MPQAAKKGLDPAQMLNELGSVAADLAEGARVSTPQGEKLSVSRGLMILGNIGGVRDQMRKDREAAVVEAMEQARGLKLVNDLRAQKLANETEDRARELRERAEIEVAKTTALGMFKKKRTAVRAFLEAAPPEVVVGLGKEKFKSHLAVRESKKRAKIQTKAARERAERKAHLDAKSAVFRAAVVSTGDTDKVAERLGVPEQKVRSVVDSLLAPPKAHGKGSKIAPRDLAVRHRATEAGLAALKSGRDPVLAGIGATMAEVGPRQLLAFDAVPKDPVATARVLLERLNLLETLQAQGAAPATGPDEDMALVTLLLADAGLSADEAQSVLAALKRLATAQ